MSYMIPRQMNGELSESMVYRISDKSWIPADTANTDYQRYLEWVAAGNSPEPFN